MQFYTRFKPPVSPGVTFELPSLVDASQQSDCDINRIIDHFRETGSLVDPIHPGTRRPVFGDFSEIPDYQGAMSVIAQADEAFMQLPAKVREKFANNPQQVFDFLADEKNRQEAVELGLIEPSQVLPVTEEKKESEPAS